MDGFFDGFTLTTARVCDGELRLRHGGSGPPLLLLNGIGGNIEMWGALARRLPGRRLFMFDAPGTGGSPAPCSAGRNTAGLAKVLSTLSRAP